MWLRTIAPVTVCAYYRTRSGKTFSDWIKGGYVVGITSQLILGWLSQAGLFPDFRMLKPIRRQAQRYTRKSDTGEREWFFLGDKGFDGCDATENHLIPPIRRYGKITIQRERRGQSWSTKRVWMEVS